VTQGLWIRDHRSLYVACRCRAKAVKPYQDNGARRTSVLGWTASTATCSTLHRPPVAVSAARAYFFACSPSTSGWRSVQHDQRNGSMSCKQCSAGTGVREVRTSARRRCVCTPFADHLRPKRFVGTQLTHRSVAQYCFRCVGLMSPIPRQPSR